MKLRKQPGCWLRSSHTLKECVIAHWSSGCAPKMSGAKPATEALECSNTLVEEHCMPVEAKRVSVGGRHRRENVGMSSERQVRILPTENLRFPEEGSSTQG